MATRNDTGRAAVGEVDVDVAEVGLDTSPRQMAERDEGLAMPPPVLEHVALDLGIAADVVVLIAEATVDLGGGVPLLCRGVLVVGEDAVDERLDRSEKWGLPVPRRCGGGLGMAEDMPDGLACVSELPGDLPDGHPIAAGPPNRAVVVHREHVLGLRVGDRSLWERSP